MEMKKKPKMFKSMNQFKEYYFPIQSLIEEDKSKDIHLSAIHNANASFQRIFKQINKK